MKFRGIILLLGSMLFVAVVLAQDSGPTTCRPLPRRSSKNQPAQAAPACSAPGERRDRKPRTDPRRPSRKLRLRPIRPQPNLNRRNRTPAPKAKADEASNPADDVATTITKTVNEVNVVFTVTDKHGRYVRNLAQGRFLGASTTASRPTRSASFHNETDLPLQVGLLVDASNSVRDRFKFEQESAIEFLNQTMRPRYDKAFVVGFDVTPEVTQDFTDNTEALSRGVREPAAGRRYRHVRCAVFCLPRQAAQGAAERAGAPRDHPAQRR